MQSKINEAAKELDELRDEFNDKLLKIEDKYFKGDAVKLTITDKPERYNKCGKYGLIFMIDHEKVKEC